MLDTNKNKSSNSSMLIFRLELQIEDNVIDILEIRDDEDTETVVDTYCKCKNFSKDIRNYILNIVFNKLDENINKLENNKHNKSLKSSNLINNEIVEDVNNNINDNYVYNNIINTANKFIQNTELEESNTSLNKYSSTNNICIAKSYDISNITDNINSNIIYKKSKKKSLLTKHKDNQINNNYNNNNNNNNNSSNLSISKDNSTNKNKNYFNNISNIYYEGSDYLNKSKDKTLDLPKDYFVKKEINNLKNIIKKSKSKRDKSERSKKYKSSKLVPMLYTESKEGCQLKGGERLYNNHLSKLKKKQQHIEKLNKLKEQNEMNNVSFVPSISNNSKDIISNNYSKYYYSNANDLTSKYSNIEDRLLKLGKDRLAKFSNSYAIKQSEEVYKYSYSPDINDKSNELAGKFKKQRKKDLENQGYIYSERTNRDCQYYSNISKNKDINTNDVYKKVNRLSDNIYNNVNFNNKNKHTDNSISSNANTDINLRKSLINSQYENHQDSREEFHAYIKKTKARLLNKNNTIKNNLINNKNISNNTLEVLNENLKTIDDNSEDKYNYNEKNNNSKLYSYSINLFNILIFRIKTNI